MKTNVSMGLPFLVLVSLACSWIAGIPDTPIPMVVITPTPTIHYFPTEVISENQNLTSVAPTTSLPPADLPFYIDCSALDPSRQTDCDSYITATRDRVYPLLRELTGTSLSSCYDGIYYTIVTDAQLSQYQGQADENHIIYSLRGSLDAAPAPLHDAHELLHTIAFCNGVLDQHIFHGAFESYVDLATTGVEWQSPGRERLKDWLETRLLPDLQTLGDATPEPGAGSRPSFNACVEIYGDLVTILYYDTGIENIKQIYRATINPGAEFDPNPTLSKLFGQAMGRQFQAVVIALKENTKYQLNIPDCGY